MSIDDLPVETLPDNCVLIVGSGPVGLVLATTLAHHGVQSMLLERNLTTTRFPKMDLTLARTMEIFHMLGFADEVRSKGVPSKFPFTVRFSSGLAADKTLTAWDLPSVDQFRERIASNNDGTMPLEPWQRLSGDVFEAFLKDRCEKNPLIEVRSGWAVKTASESKDGAEVVAVNAETGASKTIRSLYAVGCDGASSVIRKNLGIEMDGGQMHSSAVLIHFKSRDLTNLHRQGQFWHTFFPSDPAASGGSVGGAIVSQDEVDTWTVHDFLTPGCEESPLSAEETIYRALGGMKGPYKIAIDEIILQSTYRPTVAVAKAYIGPQHRLLLAGDACHQTIPSGGYGMNMGLADAFDLGWKLAAVVQGWGGQQLLTSYEEERRPVAELMLHWGKVHAGKLLGLPMAVKLDASIIDSPETPGQELRAAIDQYMQANDGHNQSFGVEMGHRYQSGICVVSKIDSELPPPEFNPRSYTPTTHPGYRAPHVFLKDGTAIFDKYGKDFTLVDFSEAVPNGVVTASNAFEEAAAKTKIPLKPVTLVGECHASQVWGARFVLIRPDGFVSWRGNEIVSMSEAEQVLAQAVGHI